MSDIIFREIKSKLNKIERHIENEKWPCLHPNCQESAINSHLLQRNGVLNNVAENGHLCEMRTPNVYERENKLFDIKKVGISQTISFPLFCSKHDSCLFKSIEGKHIDFDSYQSQLLFSYRGLCSEIRKKEYNIELYSVLPENKDKFDLLFLTKLGLEDLKHYKKLFENEIDLPHDNFTFLHLSYPFIPVYASGTSTSFSLDGTIVDSTEGIGVNQIIDSFFINIIPQKESLEIIVGYNNSHTNSKIKNYVNSWRNLSKQQLFYKIIELFNDSLESWGMSPSFYNYLVAQKIIV